MKQIEKLTERIATVVNMNLREFNFDVKPYIDGIIPTQRMIKYYANYVVTPNHPLQFHFNKSNIAGSYFLGKCATDYSILYKCDIRGDELKRKGDIFKYQDVELELENDEQISVKNSHLTKTLVHNCSHDPENPEEFLIRNTVASYYSNIHGATVEGCFLSAFSTVDLTTLHSCIVGDFSYVQAGDLYHKKIDTGTIWVKADNFEIEYKFPKNTLEKYIKCEPGKMPEGIFMDFLESRKEDFQEMYDSTSYEHNVNIPKTSSVNQYALVKGDTHIDENVLVSQSAYLENAWMGPGANAQENSYIINSKLTGCDVTAHGAKIIWSTLDKVVFVGFNCFLNGKKDAEIKIGRECIVMPHTIIDSDEPITIPEKHIVWGYIGSQKDLEENSIAIDDIASVDGEASKGRMNFNGNGKSFVEAFQHRIDHILEVNGAFYADKKIRGHAQEAQTISMNTLQPYLSGSMKGLYPTIDIRP